MFHTILGISAANPEPIAPWKMELVAEAPAIRHPTVVACAPDGRVFVAEDPMDITMAANRQEGRIICFHPDGKRTIFAENLYAVFGLQYLEGKLYVLHNPKFSVFIDNDGVAGKREELIESTNPNPWALDWNDHVPANFKLAMDGFFYVAVGDKGLYKARGRDGREVNLHGGGIVRIRPDGTGLEIFCTGVRNILDVAINDEDEIFTYDNTDEHQWMGRLTHMVEGGYYGYPHDFIPQRPYTLWMMADYGPGAATGTLCYTDDVLPKEFHNDLFLADFGKRQIMRVKIKREGATYVPVFKEDLFPNPPEDFRPVGITWGADGKSIYICDWQHRDVKVEKASVGRLWKMTYTGNTRAPERPRWYVPLATGRQFTVSDAELFEGLKSASKAVRLTAQRALSSYGNSILPTLTNRLNVATGLTKIHLLWAVDAIDQTNSTSFAAANIWDPKQDSLSKRQELRLLAIHRYGLMPMLSFSPLVDSSSDASIRFYAATALGRGKMHETMFLEQILPAVLSLLTPDRDFFANYAKMHALNSIGRKYPGAWASIVNGFGSPSVRDRAFHALRETYDFKLLQELDQSLLGRSALTMNFSESEVRKIRPLILQLVSQLHHKYPEWKGEWWAYHPALAPPPKKTVEWEGTPKVIEILTKHLSAETELATIAVEGLGEANHAASAPKIRELLAKATNKNLKLASLRALTKLKDVESASLVAKVLSSNVDEEIVSAGIEAAREFRAVEPLKEIAQTRTGKGQVAAIGALASIGGNEAEETLKALLASPNLESQREAIKVSGKFKALRPQLMDAARAREMRSEALIALSEKPELGTLDLFLAALSEKNVSVREAARRGISGIQKDALPAIEAKIDSLSPDQIAQLRTIYKDSAKNSLLFTRLTKILEPKDYADYAMTHDGNADRGRAIFANAQGVACLKCHRVGNEGGMVGPDLSTAGKQFGREALIESVVFPSKVIREGYQQTTLETKDDDLITGLNKGETPDEVRILNSEGQLISVPKSKIKSTQVSQLSMMPEGLVSALTLEEFADLIAYLQGLK